MKKNSHSEGAPSRSAEVKPATFANADVENSYFTKCELQDRPLQRFVGDLEYLRRATSNPGEPYRFNWVFGAIRARTNALLSMLARDPENDDLRRMYEDYRKLEAEVFAVAMQPPYAKSEKTPGATKARTVTIWKIIRKVGLPTPTIYRCAILLIRSQF